MRELTLLLLILILDNRIKVRGSRPHKLQNHMSSAFKSFNLNRNDITNIEMLLQTLDGCGVLNDARHPDVQTAVNAHLLIVFDEGLHEDARLDLRLSQNVLVHEGVFLELGGLLQNFLVDCH